MKIYIFDKTTGMFLTESTAQPNPKRKGEYLFPPNSTTVAPPQLKPFQTAIFHGNHWEIIKNYVGELKINKSTKEISEITVPGELSNEYMLYSEYLKSDEYKADVKKEKLESRKAEILNEMKSIDEKRIRAICEPSNMDNGHTWLEYYNEKLRILRKKLTEVENDNKN